MIAAHLRVPHMNALFDNAYLFPVHACVRRVPTCSEQQRAIATCHALTLGEGGVDIYPCGGGVDIPPLRSCAARHLYHKEVGF